jgi:hypothetical protein
MKLDQTADLGGAPLKMVTFSNLETFWRDARYGARMLRRNPSYAAVIQVAGFEGERWTDRHFSERIR